MRHGVAQGEVAKVVCFCILSSLHDPSLAVRQNSDARGERLAGGFRCHFCPIFDKMMTPKGSGSICRGASSTQLACFASGSCAADLRGRARGAAGGRFSRRASAGRAAGGIFSRRASAGRAAGGRFSRPFLPDFRFSQSAGALLPRN